MITAVRSASLAVWRAGLARNTWTLGVWLLLSALLIGTPP